MADTGAPWLDKMLSLVGTAEFPGGSNNPEIMGWARFIGLKFPEHEDYAAFFVADSIAHCGVGAAFCLAAVGIEPPFGATDTKRWMWAQSFAEPSWAFKLDQPRRGAVVVFKWENGTGHVGFVDRIEGRTIWVAGANQGDKVSVAPFAWDGRVVGFFWPKAIAAAVAPVRTPADVRLRMAGRITLAEARRDAQGHVAVYLLPPNDGGGAYEVAGINERWHPVAAAKLKALYEAGRHAELEAFVAEYTAGLTDVADLWTSSWGLEFYLRSTVFHRGPTGGAKILQRALKLRGEDIGKSGPNGDGIDGEVGPLTAAALRRQEGNVEAMLLALRQAREDYEREDVGYRANFWNGLINRFNNDLTVARRFHAEQPKDGIPMSEDPKPLPGAGDPLPQVPAMSIDPQKMTEVMNVALAVIMVMQMMKGGQVQLPGNVFPQQPPAQPQPEAKPQPEPAPPAADSTNRGPDLWAKLFGFLGAAGSVAAYSTGVIEPSTATTFGLASLFPLVGGIIGIFNPTLGGALKGLGGLIHNMTKPASPPPTR